LRAPRCRFLNETAILSEERGCEQRTKENPGEE
jgi:phage FluMu protein Com